MGGGGGGREGREGGVREGNTHMIHTQTQTHTQTVNSGYIYINSLSIKLILPTFHLTTGIAPGQVLYSQPATHTYTHTHIHTHKYIYSYTSCSIIL